MKCDTCGKLFPESFVERFNKAKDEYEKQTEYRKELKEWQKNKKHGAIRPLPPLPPEALFVCPFCRNLI